MSVALAHLWRENASAARGHDDDDDESCEHEGHEGHDRLPQQLLNATPAAQRRVLRSLLTQRSPWLGPLPADVLADIDAILQRELSQKTVVDAVQWASQAEAATAAGKMAVWRGDITALKVDCIVNAANSGMRGCFQPDHMCIDNVIHAAAGPQLRAECHELMTSIGEDHEEPIGLAKATKAYNLPSRYVLHTVGPSIMDGRRRGRISTADEDAQLASCYQSCLDCTLTLPKDVRSVAFCCVSTGLFGFPKQRAAEIAIKTVQTWLQEHPGALDLVVFNVFLEEDDLIYKQLLFPSLVPKDFIIDPLERSIAAAGQWLAQAECILIAGAAGLSASAGLDYTSEEVFKELFPVMHRRGFRRMYEFIGFTDWSEALRWGYLCSQINLSRYNWPKHPVYGKLLEIVRKVAPEDHFVLTSNADGMFEQNGFDTGKIYTAQGDYSRFQCLSRCTEQVWPARPFIDRALPQIDPLTMEIADPDAIPMCPNCGGQVVMNVRGGGWFIETPHMESAKRFQEFVARSRGRKLVILEIGAGFNTPSVVRFRCEAIAKQNPSSKFIRINATHPELTTVDLGSRAALLACDALHAIEGFSSQVFSAV